MLRNDRIARQINELWKPVYPHMVDHISSLTVEPPGTVLDLGPFAGGMGLELLVRYPDSRVVVQDETEGVLQWTQEQAHARGVANRLGKNQAPLCPLAWPDHTFDLVLVRGAFFFLTAELLAEIYRVLGPQGVAWVGGGYGPTTPESVIAPIAELSRELNEALGKKRISVRETITLVSHARLTTHAKVVEEGGLWIELRRSEEMQ